MKLSPEEITGRESAPDSRIGERGVRDDPSRPQVIVDIKVSSHDLTTSAMSAPASSATLHMIRIAMNGEQRTPNVTRSISQIDVESSRSSYKKRWYRRSSDRSRLLLIIAQMSTDQAINPSRSWIRTAGSGFCKGGPLAM